MVTVQILAWCTLAIGIAAAFALGWLGSSGFWATAGLLIADVFIGLGLTYALYFVFDICLDRLKMCAQTDEHSVWSLATPLVFIPAYWASTLFAKLIARVRSEIKEDRLHDSKRPNP